MIGVGVDGMLFEKVVSDCMINTVRDNAEVVDIVIIFVEER